MPPNQALPGRCPCATYATHDPAEAEIALRVLIRRGVRYLEMQLHLDDVHEERLYHVHFYGENSEASRAHHEAIARVVSAGRIAGSSSAGDHMEAVMAEMRDLTAQMEHLERRRQSLREALDTAQLMVDSGVQSSRKATKRRAPENAAGSTA